MEQAFLVIVLLEVMAVSLVLVGVLLYFLYRKKQQIEQLQQQLHAERTEVHDHVPRFLQQEKEQTKRAAKQADTATLWQLRQQWLDVELQSLVNNGELPSNQQQLLKLIAKFWQQHQQVVSEKSSPKSSSSSFNLAEKRLGELERLLIERNRTIIELNKKLNRPAENNEKTQEQHYNEQYKQDKQQIEQLKKRLQQAKNQNEQLNQQYNDLYEKVPPNTLLENSNDELKALRDNISSMEQTYQSALQEIVRLQQGNSEKRKVIMSLEAEFNKQQPADPDTEALINNLKLQLRDSELCTAVLESETDSLREKLKSLSEQSSELSNPDSSEINPEDSNLGEFGRHLLDTIKYISAANNETELLNILVNLAKKIELPLTCRLLINGKEIWKHYPEDKTSKETKNLVRSLKTTDDEQWLDTNFGAVMSLPRCQIILPGCKTTNSPVDLQRLAKAFSVTNSAVNRIELQHRIHQQRNNFVILVEKTQRQLQGLESQHANIHQQTSESLDALKAEVREFIQTLDLSETQARFFNEIVDDHETRLRISLQTSDIVDRSLLTVINDLSEKLTENS